ncbi:16S rRNA pseudouridine(516) synthase [Burkholderiaceae bacterium DAT-1]|nr:16S rRNA pseudouridine(516) synthase [Burkholderiaceae bacterium DAT-1]
MTPLERILQSQGFGSRKACRQIIQSGCVQVEDEICDEPSARFDLSGLRICVDEIDWVCSDTICIALNKPVNVECSRSPQHHASVFSCLPGFLVERGVQPIGRLDADTTGLLLLTDDGALNHALASPKRHVPKTYRVTLKHAAHADMIAALLAGVLLHDEDAPLAALSVQQTGALEILMTIDQGKYHQVKRMVAAAGNRVEGLHREAMGGLSLADLPALAAGEWCVLSAEQLAKLRN